MLNGGPKIHKVAHKTQMLGEGVKFIMHSHVVCQSIRELLQVL